MTSKASRAAISRPLKNMAFFDDDDSDDELDITTYDDASSAVKSIEGSMESRMKADTFALAEFLATTSPEEFAKPSKQQQQQFQRASRLLSRLRKRSAKVQQRTDSASIRSGHTSINSQPSSKSKHIPLPEYHPPEPVHDERSSRAPTALRDSGVYSETSEKDIPPPVPPVPAQSVHDLQFPMPPSVPAKSQARQPRRPAPLPAAVASAAIAVATSDKSPSLRSIPAAALKRRSIVRTRNAQVQTEATETTKASRCPHCRQCINSNDKGGERRLSCPPALAPGELLPKTAPTTEETKMLMAMIEKLQMQLAEEQQSRKKLELAMSKHQQAQQKEEQVAQERNRWKGDCLWLQDRIALLPE